MAIYLQKRTKNKMEVIVSYRISPFEEFSFEVKKAI